MKKTIAAIIAAAAITTSATAAADFLQRPEWCDSPPPVAHLWTESREYCEYTGDWHSEIYSDDDALLGQAARDGHASIVIRCVRGERTADVHTHTDNSPNAEVHRQPTDWWMSLVNQREMEIYGSIFDLGYITNAESYEIISNCT